MNDLPRPRRRIRTLAEAHELVAAWKASGLNREAWCRSQGILRSTLQSCQGRVEKRSPVPAGFIEVKPAGVSPATPASASASALTLDLGHGLRVVGLDAAAVVELVRALRAVPT
jgi:ABC-type protease/lipase transport system fused ATPase/permease subunit